MKFSYFAQTRPGSVLGQSTLHSFIEAYHFYSCIVKKFEKNLPVHYILVTDIAASVTFNIQ